MTYPNDETGQVLTEMQEAGIDLSIIHPIVFFQLFENKQQAQAMADHLAEKAPDMLISLHPDQIPNVWDLDCTVNMLPDHSAILAQEAQFAQIAAKFNGYNDGWGIQT